MKIKIEDMRDWVRDYALNNAEDRSDDGDGTEMYYDNLDLELFLEELEDWEDWEVAEEYVNLKLEEDK